MQMQPGMPMMGMPMVAQPVAVTLQPAYPPKAWPMVPVDVQCHKCAKTGITEVENVAGGFAFILCLVLVILGCWLGCCVIPFFVPACMDQIHRCSKCSEVLGARRVV